MTNHITRLTLPERTAAAAAAVTLALAGANVAAGAGRADVPRTVRVVRSSGVVTPPQPPPAPAATPTPTPDTPLPPSGIAITKHGTAVRSEPTASAREVSRLRAGIVLPVARRAGGFLSVLTPCQVAGWVSAGDVEFVRAGELRRPGRGMDLGDATIVLDAGHGGRAKGATGPGGLEEKEANLKIVDALAQMLSRRDGGRSPNVILTRGGDFDAGLVYRAQIANAAGAHAFMSVHNNAEPDGPSSDPGTETYYQYRSADSKRLSGLAYEEVVTALRGFPGVAWVGERDAGAKYRLSETGTDYYGLLRRSSVPTSLVEVAFISNAPEEELLRREDFRQSVAGALHRALVRFLTTDEPGSGFVEPYPRKGGPSGALPSSCLDPA